MAPTFFHIELDYIMPTACAYKFFTGYRMWRTRTGERAPFLCTALIFIRAGDQCFMPPVIVHQAKKSHKIFTTTL